MMVGSARAENPENDLGSWVNANSTVRFSDRWSFFAQAEVRNWKFASNLNEILLRGAGHYDFSPRAMGGLGYVYVDFRPFDDGDNGSRDIIENRLYQPKSGSWDLPEMRDCLYGGSHEDFTSFPNRSPCG
jgi:hypothetical protein